MTCHATNIQRLTQLTVSRDWANARETAVVPLVLVEFRSFTKADRQLTQVALRETAFQPFF